MDQRRTAAGEKWDIRSDTKSGEEESDEEGQEEEKYQHEEVIES